ncbi:MAG: 50S ribosomal protein L13 [Parcubacteria group bacterium RIFCSPLOWO2_01_FULL_40_65]|nr:MAG: 50S ribosomal protein L13 [Parcubacteria group bacterium RIFCSPHIGHO2_01_FULL_40_30]OHB19158.1 MAG: 50S ribosomal protein L13 [Parcubacteria group bacterium RIFCSPHIGHO2_02_FULL_40_12]OHB21318.1 MAG: 50S ribosomal protein L13 [Parcubacteria group bacterium RIFCSPLOWO2_01_FULL_40_65]OHB23185.1 MAG: 50S ribosomal protein L13 [Parcubacteria group bacterium RIFCSPLOWO2_02_FULL_40_12]OHB23778.1 MAG: 50S ribosomal protein L13 [Parcubacteria group bacterium RIFCSPLOWO2_12_FULL_40_10]
MIHEIDATNQSLGRLASKIALILRGKMSPKFESHILSGERVMVLNAGKIKFTGRKLEQKRYFHYSGYPGGLRTIKVKDVFEKNPSEVLRRAVLGMLPKNRLRKEMIKNLQFR